MTAATQARPGQGIRTNVLFTIRLGADFQMFFDEGENLKTLRLGAGITF